MSGKKMGVVFFSTTKEREAYSGSLQRFDF
jgi:hypothetical protein